MAHLDRVEIVGGGPAGLYTSILVRQHWPEAQVIVHEPPVLLLDEPTAALDLVHAQDLRQQVAQIGTDRCVVLTSHLVDDVEHLGDRLLVLRDGGIEFEGSSLELARRTDDGASLGASLATMMGGGQRCS